MRFNFKFNKNQYLRNAKYALSENEILLNSLIDKKYINGKLKKKNPKNMKGDLVAIVI